MVKRLLGTLLTATPSTEVFASVREWKPQFDAVGTAFANTLDRAFVGGLHADRVGFAFACGYQCALHAIDPALDARQLASFCATESKGAHPRSIATKLEPDGTGYRVRGEKRWSTMAPDADVLLVVTSRGARDDGTNDLAMVRVAARGAGVSIAAMPQTAFVPEILHAHVTLDTSVSADAVMPGDGYTRYVKAFRTIEDMHVHAALLGHLIRIARLYDWPRASIEQALVLVTSLRSLGDVALDAPETHIALAGALAGTRAWIEANAAHWSKVDPDVRDRWTRDLPLMQVADAARTQRTERAWQRIAEGA